MVDAKVIDNESNISFEGNGFCVTPNAGCPQKLNPLLVLIRLLTFLKDYVNKLNKPNFRRFSSGKSFEFSQEEGSEFEHKVDFEVNGSSIK